MFRFALCADDYAITPGVSRGILELLETGHLTAVSALVTGPAWAAASGDLKPFAGSVDIGLHLNLTLGAPLGAMRGLSPSGRFPALGKLVRSVLLGRVATAEMADEIGRQIDAFAQHFGRWPDYVDGHQHVHALPGVRDALFRILQEQGLSGPLWLRDPGDRLHAILARPLRGKALAVAGLTAGFASAATASGFALNEGFAGFSDFAASRDYGALFPSFLRSPGRRHLVMCHPGHSDDNLASLDPAVLSRDAELAFLLSPGFADVLAKHSAALMRLSEERGSH
ncbi:MAG: ChbG/HpnK family deacetylase [Methylobacteriaceae bacterium]|nr:ChbG/HpnK family deacetylase [Methylobacteriaceae bacterium]